jgi:hypothetical protein
MVWELELELQLKNSVIQSTNIFESLKPQQCRVSFDLKNLKTLPRLTSQ